MDIATDTVIQLDCALTVRTAAETQQSLLQSLNSNKSVTIDVADDAQVDISFLQLIVAARRYAKANGKSLELLRPAGGNVLEVLQRGGFLDVISPDDARFWLHEGQLQ